jgi:hypothetical protein
MAFRNSYANPIFGYSVAIPENLIGFGAMPPAPNHGISINTAAATIEVDAEYNALDFASAMQQAKMRIDDLKRWDGASKIKIERETTKLCNLPAVQQTVEYEDSVGARLVEESVFALLSRKKYGDITYEVTLRTIPPSLTEARPLFLKILWSFKCMSPTG